MGSLKFELIRRALSRKPTINVTAICRLAGVSRSGYYYHLLAFPLKTAKDEVSLNQISEIFERRRKRAGIDSIDMDLRAKGIVINRKKIARIKRQNRLYAIIRKKNPYKDIPLKSGEHKMVPNLLRREFYTPIPDSIYSTDMTYLYYGNCEKAYLSATKDLCTNEVVSSNLMRTPTVDSFVREFERLLGKLPVEQKKELIIHSDQGFQYTHPSFQELLKKEGVKQSMSRQGNCLDNAPIESFFGHLKDILELKNCKTFEDVRVEVERSIKYYNVERPQKALNKKLPAEYRGLICGFL